MDVGTLNECLSPNIDRSMPIASHRAATFCSFADQSLFSLLTISMSAETGALFLPPCRADFPQFDYDTKPKQAIKSREIGSEEEIEMKGSSVEDHRSIDLDVE